jgi:transcriptional/translational regulatory protein YebC/TACO1
MTQPKAKTNSGPKVEVVLKTLERRKSVVRFVDPTEDDAQVTNIYLKNDGFKSLGTPKAVKVTVEPYNGDE